MVSESRGEDAARRRGTSLESERTQGESERRANSPARVRTGPLNSESETDPVLEEIDRLAEDLRARRNRPDTLEVSLELMENLEADRSRIESPWSPANLWQGGIEERIVETTQDYAALADKLARLETVARELQDQVRRMGAGTDRQLQKGVFRPAIGSPDSPTPESTFATCSDPISSARTLSPESGGDLASIPTPVTGLEASTPAVFERFTVDRYNRTIGALKRRHAPLAAVTLLLSAGIGVVLVEVVLHSPPSTPPAWVAALPLVWLVPLPFFLLAFRGTHRVLERNHLDLPDVK